MATTTSDQKKKLSRKFLEFQKKGLVQYGKYLEDQLVFASKSAIRKQYKKYIEDQIKLNHARINKIDTKLK